MEIEYSTGLTVTQAETALLALGPKLEFDNSGYSQRFNDETCFYISQWFRLRGGYVNRFIDFTSDDSDWDKTLYPTWESAKAACERHYATGSWP